MLHLVRTSSCLFCPADSLRGNATAVLRGLTKTGKQHFEMLRKKVVHHPGRRAQLAQQKSLWTTRRDYKPRAGSKTISCATSSISSTTAPSQVHELDFPIVVNVLTTPRLLVFRTAIPFPHIDTVVSPGLHQYGAVKSSSFRHECYSSSSPQASGLSSIHHFATNASAHLQLIFTSSLWGCQLVSSHCNFAANASAHLHIKPFRCSSRESVAEIPFCHAVCE
jgi:hypothetical protein